MLKLLILTEQFMITMNQAYVNKVIKDVAKNGLKRKFKK